MAGVRDEARAAIESLRFGTPPTGRVLELTVGRAGQIEQLRQTLESDDGGALLLRANYGAGKTHLLRVIREAALDAGFAVAFVVTDAVGGIRFNRMDTIFGAVCRGLEVEGRHAGIGGLFDEFLESYGMANGDEELQRRISSGGRWAPNGPLSAALQVGLRSWVVGTAPHRQLVAEWLSWPEAYRNRRKDLYFGLVDELASRVADPRPEWQFYADDVFSFHTDGHQGAWDGLASLDLIAKAAGLGGLVILFDEFEDVIQNLNNRDWQVAAFTNLFRFFGGGYPGTAYFAVTPDFAKRCKEELLQRGVYDFPISDFDQLPAFELDPIGLGEFQQLAQRIAGIHGLANGHAPRPFPTGALEDAWGHPAPDQVRQAIQRLVSWLDRSR